MRVILSYLNKWDYCVVSVTASYSFKKVECSLEQLTKASLQLQTDQVTQSILDFSHTKTIAGSGL